MGKMNILYEDNHIIVVEKPVNMPVQEDASGDADMLTLLKAYIKEKYNKPGEVFLGLVHRLDRPVSGVMVFARTSKAASRLGAQFASRGAKKRYMAVLCGTLNKKEKLECSIYRDERTGTSRVCETDTPGAKHASLMLKSVCSKRATTLADIELFTGRHHQIRVQCADAGYPIWGDARYNKASKPGEQIALCAYFLEFEHPTKKERMRFSCVPDYGAFTDYAVEARALEAGVRINYIDADIVVADKDAGMESTVADGGECTVEGKLKKVLGSVFAVHRLDATTSGLMVLARNERAKAELDAAMSERTAEKYYRCIVTGVPERDSFILDMWGIKDSDAGLLNVYSEKRKDAKQLITKFRVLERRKDTAVLEATLVTGRTHQIRACLAAAGYPILGDDRYGSYEFNRKKKCTDVMLSCVRLVLHFGSDSCLSRLDGAEFTAGAGF